MNELITTANEIREELNEASENLQTAMTEGIDERASSATLQRMHWPTGKRWNWREPT